MNVIVLTGPSSCGKTTTLNVVYNMIMSGGGQSTARQQEGGNPHDFSDTILYNGKKIGFLTMGDYAYRVIDLLNQFGNQNYDVFVTACNDRFVRPFKYFNNYPNNIIRKQQQPVPSQRNADDTAAANTIFNLI